MKILIKKQAIIKFKRLIYLASVFLPLFLVPFLIIFLGVEYWDELFLKEEKTPEVFTFNVPQNNLTIEPISETERDSNFIYSEEILPENFFPLASPDPDRIYYEVKEIDASREAGSEGISINDSTNSSTDIKPLLKEEYNPDFGDYILYSDEPLVLIYHTHTSESFENSFRGFYYEDDYFRTENLEENVCAVGEAMKKILEEKGIKVIHDTTFHDTPMFNGAYSRSKETVLSYLEKYPSIKITIDLHRDAMVTDEGLSYKPTVKIDGKKAAQMMIIAGCDPDNELGYENWLENLPFSLHIQKTAESLYPNLMRPLMFARRSYNMGLTDTSFLLEVGTQSNTLSEAVYSGKLMGNILSEVILKYLE